MATYKKRGYKPKTKEEVVEQVEDNSTTAEVFNTLDETASRTEDFVAKNQKYIFMIIGAVAVFVLGYLGYNELVTKPAQAEAMDKMYHAQKHFDQAVSGVTSDSLYKVVLEGSEGKFGMLNIIENYNGTPAANLAKYYVGMSYLNLKKYKSAIEYLQDYKGKDQTTGPMAVGAIGDAFVQLEQNDKALPYYVDAANMHNNEFTTPGYLQKAGVIALDLGKAKEALTYFDRIKEEFSKSEEAKMVDVFIGKAEAMANK